MRFLLVNLSTLVSNAQAAAIAHACNQQMALHVAPLWDRKPAPVAFGAAHSPPNARIVKSPAVPKRFAPIPSGGAPPSDEAHAPAKSAAHDPGHPHTAALLALVKKEAAAGAIVVSILDDADQEGALGYHTLGPDGKPLARVFARDTLSQGATVLGPNGMGTVVSHEIIETEIDLFCNAWDDATIDGSGDQWAHEAGDPVESDGYAIIAGVYVSNFVTPAFFDAAAQDGDGGRYDYMKKLSGPFMLDTGGYAVVRHSDGTTEAIFGDEVSEAKKASIRSRRRFARRHPAGTIQSSPATTLRDGKKNQNAPLAASTQE